MKVTIAHEMKICQEAGSRFLKCISRIFRLNDILIWVKVTIAHEMKICQEAGSRFLKCISRIFRLNDILIDFGGV